MADRYEVFAEWHDNGIKRYRIYDKHTDSIIGLFGTHEEASLECASLLLAHTRSRPCGHDRAE